MPVAMETVFEEVVATDSVPAVASKKVVYALGNFFPFRSPLQRDGFYIFHFFLP